MVRTRPGLAPSTTMRSAMKATSLMSWLTIRMLEVVLILLRPDVEHLGAQALGGEGVDLAERLVHEEHLGLDGEGARHADALLHAAGELARVGLLEAGEADHGEDLADALGALGRVDAAGLEDDVDVLGDGHPRVEREALEDDGDAGVQARERLAVVEDLALGRLDEAGEDAEDGRFAAARRAEQGDDLAAAGRRR